MIARLYRLHAVPFALGFAAVVILFELLPRLVFLIDNSFQHERFVPYLWGYIAFMPRAVAIIMTGVLLGAVIARPRRRPQTTDSGIKTPQKV